MKYAQYNTNCSRNQSFFEKFSIFVDYDYILCLQYYVYLNNRPAQKPLKINVYFNIL